MPRLKGFYHSKETKEKMSLARLKNPIIHYGEFNPSKRIEVKLKISLKQKGIKETSEASRKTHVWMKENKLKMQIRNEKIRMANTGYKMPVSQKQKIGIATKRNWQKPEYRENIIRKTLKSLLKRPTKPEKELIDIIQQNNFPFVYTGNGKIIIDRFCPDFIDNDGSKKIIEVFSDYWHNRYDVKERDKRRMETYSKYGFKTLIIWQSEINSKEKVIEKIRGFINENLP